MEEKFIAAWMQARQTAKELGVRMRPMEPSDALRQARYCLDSHRVSDGFEVLADKGRLDLTLEALAVDKRFTALFTDNQAEYRLGPPAGKWLLSPIEYKGDAFERVSFVIFERKTKSVWGYRFHPIDKYSKYS